MLDDRLKKILRDAHGRMLEAGELLPFSRLKECYSLFGSRFGPDVLRRLDGELLLNTMHAHGKDSKDSLVYWLEFKNDEELPAKFGSIAGGSALKFRIYRRKDTGVWMTGSSRKQEELSVNDAIAIARKHRDQLAAGVDALSRLAHDATDAEYLSLQQEMDSKAPDVSRTAWGHKYFSLLFPDKLDDYHVEEYQRFHLVKLLKRPPEGTGRYLAAGMFMRLARELKWPANHLTSVLNEVNGPPYQIWRVGTDLGESPSDTIWPSLRDQNCVAIGWPIVGDLSRCGYSQESKSQIAYLLVRHYGMAPNVASRKAGEILNFTTVMAEGEPVLAASGKRILGLGRIAGPYRFDPQANEDAPHQRSVTWEWTGEFTLPSAREGLRTTVYRLRESDNLIDVEGRLLRALSRRRRRINGDPGRKLQLDGISGRVQVILERKGQVILYGPPGTGKTFWARRAGLDLVALSTFGQRFEQLDASGRARVEGSSDQLGLLRMCTFHPAYGYEDFIEGYRPEEHGGTLHFSLTDGIFKQLCADAERAPQQRFILLVDEINRGDIPRIFGELLTLLERDKRGQAVYLPVSGERFSVPANVQIIGTMNTADRSIALLDTALRRRFGFVELMPDPAVLGDAVVADSIPLGEWLAALNDRIREHIGRDARNLQVGHSYLMQDGRPLAGLHEFV